MPDDAVPDETGADRASTAAGDGDAWLRLVADVGSRLDLRVGVSGTVGVVITGTSAGDALVTLVWEDGRIVGASSGTPPAADVTFTLPAAEARAVLAGELSPSVAFMRGRLKTAGDNGLVIGVLGACDGAPLAALVDAVHRPVA